MDKKKDYATPHSKSGLKTLKKNGRQLIREAEGFRKRYLAEMKDRDAVLLEAGIQKVQSILSRNSLELETIPELEEATRTLDGLIATFFGKHRKSALREYIESILYAVVIALGIRTAIVEPFKIPTGSMIPTLEINDHIFVSKFAYGIRIPFTNGFRVLQFGKVERGDVIVFENPGEGEDHGKDFIKRVVAVEGDRIRLENNTLYVNDAPVPTRILGVASCADSSQRECVFQEEKAGDHTYRSQHVVPGIHHTVPGDTFASVGKQYGVSPESLLALNQNRLTPEQIRAAKVLEIALQPDTMVLLRPDARWAIGNIASWPMGEPACPLPSQNVPCFGAESQGNTAYPDVTVPVGHVLTFGDNRDNSRDGRFWGFVPFENVKGRAFVIWYANKAERIFSAIP